MERSRGLGREKIGAAWFLVLMVAGVPWPLDSHGLQPSMAASLETMGSARASSKPSSADTQPSHVQRSQAALQILDQLLRQSDEPSLPLLRSQHEAAWLAKLAPLLDTPFFRERLLRLGFENDVAWAQTLSHLASVMLYLRRGRDEETLARLRDLMDKPLPEERKRRILAMIRALEPSPEAIALVQTLQRHPRYRHLLEMLAGLE